MNNTLKVYTAQCDNYTYSGGLAIVIANNEANALLKAASDGWGDATLCRKLQTKCKTPQIVESGSYIE